MVFNSYTFVIFFGLVLLLYYGVGSWRARKTILLLASYVFYAAWNPPFVLLLMFSTVADWFAARGIFGAKSPRSRHVWLAVTLVANFGLLGFFKYGTFLLDNFLALARTFGLDLTMAQPDIILPVGISFYTFQTLSYTLDVYRGQMQPCKSFLDYALYVTFFPQLVAGPIVRAADFLPQCETPKRFSGEALGHGLALMLLGLFEKVAVADGLLAPIVEDVYDAGSSPNLVSAWTGTLAFAGQIFCDFAGYSTCAIGAAICLGFVLCDNFRFPYASIGFSDFWRRWHISLSSWLKDYLYIPLGGNRAGHARTYVNLMVTMLLGGLWHGASWTFVVWGGLHGLYLAVERAGKRSATAVAVASRTPKIVLAGGTFLLVCVAWVFFRAGTFGRAAEILTAMAGLHEGTELVRKLNVPKVLLVVGLLLTVHWWMRDRTLTEVAGRLPWWVKSCVLAAMGVGIVLLSGEDHAFIYFQF